MATQTPKHILIAPLDWGLGHTTRCIPIIRYILSLGHIPIVAGNAAQASFIKETFSDIEIIHLEGYNISYSKWNRWAQAGLLSQMPRVSKVIAEEQQWLMNLCRERQIDGIISDNRYGIHHPSIPCAIITHQLMVQTGMGNAIDRMVQRLHYKYLEKFGSIWVADVPGAVNLSGKLGHCTQLPAHIQYIGLLSRFAESGQGGAQGSDLLILLSGPEPQRSDVARLLWQQACRHKGKVTFVEGSESVTAPATIPNHITYHKRVSQHLLGPLLQNATIVVCRSGYSTIMDLVAMNKKAILIPTPGQTEQEYLGRYLHKAGIYYCAAQKGFQLDQALNDSAGFSYKLPFLTHGYRLHEEIIAQWLI